MAPHPDWAHWKQLPEGGMLHCGGVWRNEFKLSGGLWGIWSALKPVISTPQLGILWEVERGKGRVEDKGRQSPGKLRGLWKLSCLYVNLLKWHSHKSETWGQGEILGSLRPSIVEDDNALVMCWFICPGPLLASHVVSLPSSALGGTWHSSCHHCHCLSLSVKCTEFTKSPFCSCKPLGPARRSCTMLCLLEEVITKVPVV